MLKEIIGIFVLSWQLEIHNVDVIVNRFYSLSAQIVELLNFRLKRMMEYDVVESTDS